MLRLEFGCIRRVTDYDAVNITQSINGTRVVTIVKIMITHRLQADIRMVINCECNELVK